MKKNLNQLERSEKASQTRRSRFILVTIVRNGNSYVSIDEINDIYKRMIVQMSKYGVEWSDNIGYELKKNNVIHMHTMCSCERSPFFKSPIGWNVQLKTIKDISEVPKVLDYINKCKNQYDGDIMQLEAASYYYTKPIGEVFID